jgi:hypothetical protein
LIRPYTTLCIPWRDSISRPMTPQAETTPLDLAARALLYIFFTLREG